MPPPVCAAVESSVHITTVQSAVDCGGDIVTLARIVWPPGGDVQLRWCRGGGGDTAQL